MFNGRRDQGCGRPQDIEEICLAAHRSHGFLGGTCGKFLVTYLLFYLLLDLNRFSISQKIVLENRFKNDKGNDCLLSVDGTDFQRSKTSKDWFSYKFRRSGLRYEVATSILGGDICWICGPWKPGKYNDLDIFREALATWLEPNERVEADDGYAAEAPLRVKCPASIAEPVERAAMTQRVRSRHETVNKRFKQWGILRQVFRHDLANHRNVFAAICVVTQLAIENGEPLFEVHYDDDNVKF